LLSTLRSEAELVAVLSHEVGHIEQGHCFDAVKFQLVTAKVGAETLGELADLASRFLVRHAFSKTQENEADEYAWSRLTGSHYDPAAAGGAFAAMIAWVRASSPGGGGSAHANLLRDYFSSHPPLEIREAKYRERAESWWRSHGGERRYTGSSNLTDRKSLPGGADRAHEWTGSATARLWPPASAHGASQAR
jgi:predicted Zn-dependent protease